MCVCVVCASAELPKVYRACYFVREGNYVLIFLIFMQIFIFCIYNQHFASDIFNQSHYLSLTLACIHFGVTGREGGQQKR